MSLRPLQRPIITDTTPRAAEAYAMRRRQVATKLGELGALLKEHERFSRVHDGGLTWAHVGDLAHVADTLDELLTFLAVPK